VVLIWRTWNRLGLLLVMRGPGRGRLLATLLGGLDDGAVQLHGVSDCWSLVCVL